MVNVDDWYVDEKYWSVQFREYVDELWLTMLVAKVPHWLSYEIEYIELNINTILDDLRKYLCAWGNDAASEVLTEARLLLVENYFQTPS